MEKEVALSGRWPRRMGRGELSRKGPVVGVEWKKPYCSSYFCEGRVGMNK